MEPYRLRFSCSNCTLNVFQKFLSCVPTDGDSKVVEKTVLSVVLIHAWTVIVMNSHNEEEACGGKRQEQYADLFAMHLQQASNPNISEFEDPVA